MSANSVRIGLVAVATLGLVVWTGLLSCRADEAPSSNPPPVVSADAGASDAGSVDGHLPDPEKRLVSRFPLKHLGWQVRSHRGGVRFLTWRHPYYWHLWIREVPLSGQISLDDPSLILDTEWAGEPYFVEIPSPDGPVSAVFLHGLNPKRYPILYRVLLPGGDIHQLFACDMGGPPLFSNAMDEGAFWVGLQRDCTQHCKLGVSVFYGLRLDDSGAVRALGPICPLPDIHEPQKLLVHPTRQLALVISHAPYERDGSIDTDLYVRFVSFDESGRTGMTSQYKPEKTSQVFRAFFLPHRRAAIYWYADPTPFPGGPLPTVTEIRELSWGEKDEIVESLFEPANTLLWDLLSVHALDGQRWVLVGRARNPADPQLPWLALLFDGDQLIGTAPLEQRESGGTIVSWRGEPFIFWDGLADDGQTREVWTRRLDFEPVE